MANTVFRYILIMSMLLFGVVASVNPAMAAQINVVDGRYAGEKYVSISGPISSGDYEKFEFAARNAIRHSNRRLALLLNSNGGDVSEAIKIGRLARELLATTYVYGNTFYIPDTPEGKELEEYGKEHSQIKFGLRPVSSGKLNTQDIVSCYNACVIIFYGGVSRHVSDNNDYRSGFKKGRQIPVIGIHRPYYDQAAYSSLSPSEARVKYQELEVVVRAYLLEMGAPTALIDRMFKKASNDVELISSEEFKESYQDEEPFIEEWLIAKCGAYGPQAALSEQEQKEYESYSMSLKRAIDAGHIRSEKDYNEFTAFGISSGRFKQLEEKTFAANATVMKCRDTAIVDNQATWAIHNN